jgi:hypothetical protein
MSDWRAIPEIQFGNAEMRLKLEQSRLRHSGTVRWHQTLDVQLHIGESLDPRFDAEPVIGPRFARTRWRRPGMTASEVRAKKRRKNKD